MTSKMTCELAHVILSLYQGFIIEYPNNPLIRYSGYYPLITYEILLFS
ncbi:hypothetical protein [Sediminibacillus massiliensis]|nr:hypothetical protein [Sediminibacillus massiliensis]